MLNSCFKYQANIFVQLDLACEAKIMVYEWTEKQHKKNNNKNYLPV